MKRLKKSNQKVVDGVLAGFAEYLGIDPVWVRLGYVLFGLVGDFGIAFILYLIAIFIMPRSNVEVWSKSDTNKTVDQLKGRLASNKYIVLVGLGLIALGVLFLVEQFTGFSIIWQIRSMFNEIRTYILPIMLILLGFWMITRFRK